MATAGALVMGAGQATAASDLPNAVLIDGEGTSEESSYEFSVSDTVERIYAADHNEDTITDGTVSGTIGDDVAAYAYDGEITDLRMEGPASVHFGSEVGDLVPEPGRELIIRTDTQLSYEFTTTGEIEKLLENGRDSAELTNDHVEQNADGTWTATGYTGNGYGDSYTIRGDVLEFSPEEGEYSLLLDGEPTDAYELTGTEPPEEDEPTEDELVIRSDTEISYEFTTAGETEKLLENGRDSAEVTNDHVEQNADGTWTTTGYTGNGYGDSYTIRGDVLSFSPMSGDYSLLLNGEPTDAYELTGTDPADEPEPTDDANIGGGDGYENTVTRSDATYVATSRSELVGALDRATSGDIVFVPGNTSINMGSTRFNVRSGVTLASDRGVDGSNGGRLVATQESERKYITVGDGGRVTGIRVHGPFEGAERLTSRRTSGGNTINNDTGIQLSGNCEVDNCEVAGFGYDGIRSRSGGNHVHHNYIYDCNLSGYGYGVLSRDGMVTIEYNRFEYNRHSVVTDSGYSTASYTVRYNVFDNPLNHHVDSHSPGGHTLLVYNNSFLGRWSREGDDEVVKLNGAPENICEVHHNWCRPYDGADEAFNQDDVQFPTNFEWWDNAYGTTEPAATIGHPR